jgi:HTH-type transcriptional regulator / antitoxin HipB
MTKSESARIGTIIRLHRKKAGLTQRALAELAGVGKTLVFDIEKDKQTVQWDSIGKILKVLNISIEFKSPIMKELEEEIGKIDNAKS